jgi:hypothetical protein
MGLLVTVIPISQNRSKHEAKKAIDPLLAATCARGLQVRKKPRAAEGGSISTAEAAARLGISRSVLLRRYRSGKVLGWMENDEAEVRFPLWQFEGTALLPGLTEVLSALKAVCRLNDAGRMLFFLSEFGFLGSRRPLDLLRDGQIENALRAASAYTMG